MATATMECGLAVNEFGASLGLDVLWYPDGDMNQIPHPAKVVSVGNTSVNLAIFEKDNCNMIVRDGVKHVNDKTLRPNELTEQGTWSHTPAHDEYLAFKRKVENFMASQGKSK